MAADLDADPEAQPEATRRRSLARRSRDGPAGQAGGRLFLGRRSRLLGLLLLLVQLLLLLTLASRPAVAQTTSAWDYALVAHWPFVGRQETMRPGNHSAGNEKRGRLKGSNGGDPIFSMGNHSES